MKNPSPLPAAWLKSYARERRARQFARVWNAITNALCVFGFLALFYFALVLCSVLEPGVAPQLP